MVVLEDRFKFQVKKLKNRINSYDSDVIGVLKFKKTHLNLRKIISCARNPDYSYCEK